jgi:hypothetical protein
VEAVSQLHRLAQRGVDPGLPPATSRAIIRQQVSIQPDIDGFLGCGFARPAAFANEPVPVIQICAREPVVRQLRRIIRVSPVNVGTALLLILVRAS